MSCHYEHYHGIQVVDISDKRQVDEFWKLLNYIDQFQEQISVLRLDPLEVSKIIYKYFKMEAKTMKALRRIRVDVSSYVECLDPDRVSFLDSLYRDAKKASGASK